MLNVIYSLRRELLEKEKLIHELQKQVLELQKTLEDNIKEARPQKT